MLTGHNIMPMTSAEKQRRYRDKMKKENPEEWSKYLEKNRKRSKKNRALVKLDAEKDKHQRELVTKRQKQYQSVFLFL